VLGGNNSESTSVDGSSSTSNQEFGTNPQVGLNLGDILQSTSYNSDGDDGDVNYESFGGIGDVDLNVAAPIHFSNSNSDDSFSGTQSESDGGGGGLLGGLL
jgi:hypothetical protein